MAATTVEAKDLSARLQELLRMLKTGKEIVITENNAPRARLLPVPESKERMLGLNAGTVTMAEDFTAPLPDDFWAGPQ